MKASITSLGESKQDQILFAGRVEQVATVGIDGFNNTTIECPSVCDYCDGEGIANLIALGYL